MQRSQSDIFFYYLECIVFNLLKYLLVMLVLVLQSCGGGSESSPKTSSGFLSAAPINDANCAIYKITSEGVRGDKLTSTISNKGTVVFSNVGYSGKALIECSAGGKYIDETTGNEKLSPILRVALNFIEGEKFAITPLTEIATQIDSNLNNVINIHNDTVANAFGLSGKNITSILPADVDKMDLINDDAGNYAMILAMLSKLESQNTSEGSNLSEIINSLKADLIDGTLDQTTAGKLSTAFSALDSKFKNTNFTNIKGSVISNAINTSFVGAKLVSASSGSVDKISLDWMEASGDDIEYEVHISTTKDFEPSASTLKLTTKELSASIDATLTADTLYYATIVAKNTESSRPSNQLSVKTSRVAATQKTGLKISTEKLVASDDGIITTQATVVKDEIIFSTIDNSAQLKQVVSVTTNAIGETVAETKSVNLRDVYQNLSFSSSIKLEEVADTANTTVVQSQSIGAYQNQSFLSQAFGQTQNANIKTTKQYKRQWKSGLVMGSTHYAKANQLSVNSAALHAVSTYSAFSNSASSEVASDSQGDFKGSIPKVLITKVGESLNQLIALTSLQEKQDFNFPNIDKTDADFESKLEAQKTVCRDANGVFEKNNINFWVDNYCSDASVEICRLTTSIETTKPENVNSSNLPIIEVNNNQPYLKWSPRIENVDQEAGEPYLLDIDIDTIQGVACGTDYEKTNGEDTIDLNNVKLYANNPLPTENGGVKLADAEKTILFENSNFSINNKFKANFSPEIKVNFDIQLGSIKKAEAGVKAVLEFGNLFTIKAQGSGSHIFTPKPIKTYRFLKIVQAGVVPVVLIGDLRFMAIAEIEASGKLDAVVESEAKLTMSINMVYNTSTKKWEISKDKEFTYKFKAGGKANAEATVIVRIIPTLEVSLYEAAAFHASLEPYLYSTVGVNGEINLTLSNEQSVLTDSAVQFTKLEAGIGMDIRVYAGSAWNATDQFLLNNLIYPEGAVYAPTKLGSKRLRSVNFMNSSSEYHRRLTRAYYQTIRDDYKTFEVLAKNKILGIPRLSYTINTSDKPPSDINSRAIKLIPSCTAVDNIFYTSLGLGKKNYIKCANWSIEKISNNFDITHDRGGEFYWLTPNDISSNILRLVNNSSLGWARQYIRIENTYLAADANSIPDYFKNRYGLTDTNQDQDNDGFSNLAEFKAGTDPSNQLSRPLTALNQPTNFNVIAGNELVNLRWDRVPGADSYTVYRSTSNITNLSGLSKINTNTLAQTISNLTNNTTYYFVITAVKEGIESTPSVVVSATPVATLSKPLIANLPTKHLILNNSITAFAFNNMGGIADSCSVPSLPSGLSVTPTSGSCQISGTPTTLQDATTYTIKVANTAGDDTATISISVGLDMPKNLTATKGNATIALTWDVVSGAIGYQVYYAKQSFSSIGSNLSNYASLNGGSLLQNITGNSKTIANLTNDTKYYFVIIAVKDTFESGGSSEATATPQAQVGATLTETLNDTGITWGGYDLTGNNVTCTGMVISAQDCSHGRDARAAAGTLTKVGDGRAGFDFTKLGSTGNVLTIQNATWTTGGTGTESAGTKWSCVKDNHTGLVWEVKTDDGSKDNNTTNNTHTNIHHKDNRYRWGGKTALGRIHTKKEGTYHNDWTGLVDGTNTANFCGGNNWRVPTLGELRSIADLSTISPAIDSHYFPNTTANDFWSSSPYTGNSSGAWRLDFDDGYDYTYNRNYNYYVRLVRSEQ